MPDITDPQVVKWSNERTRTMADLITRLSYAVSAWQADYAAQIISAQITAAGPSEYVADGADVDGRSRIKGVDIQNFHAGVGALRTALDAVVVGVGVSVVTMANGIQVNGSPR